MTLPVATKDGRANLLRAFKATGCAVCGVRYPEVDWSDLHIHHLDPVHKPRDRTLATNRVYNRRSAEDMLTELLGCEVLCRACHVKRHSNGGGAPIEGQMSMLYGSGGWTYA